MVGAVNVNRAANGSMEPFDPGSHLSPQVSWSFADDAFARPGRVRLFALVYT